MIVNLGYKLSEFSVQCPCFLLNKRVLTWEESDKRILHSTLQADLWVTKDTNKKGDMSSQWCSQAGELFGWKPCTKTETVQWMKVAFRTIQSLSAHKAFKENHFSVLQRILCFKWGHRSLQPSPSSFPILSHEVTKCGKVRRETRSLRLTGDAQLDLKTSKVKRYTLHFTHLRLNF